MKLLVVACNSVEVSAIDDIAHRAGIPVVGVIDPGTRAAVRTTRNGIIGLIGTQATVTSGAYDRAVRATNTEVTLRSQACPAFVEHVERGDTTSAELREAARGYLSPLMADGIDTLILGCTHYPLLSGLLQRELGPGVVLVSSAEETAKDVYAALLDHDLQRDANRRPLPRVPGDRRPGCVRACRGHLPGSGAFRGGRRPGATRGRRFVELTVLGMSGTWPPPGGATCGYLVTHDDTAIWLDAGTGTMSRLQQHVAIGDLDAIVISHGHPDHFVDTIPAFYARHYGKLGEPGLPFYSPPGFVDLISLLVSEDGKNVMAEAYAFTTVHGGDSFEWGRSASTSWR